MSADESYPSSNRLQDAGQGVVLELEKLRWLTVNLETVGVIVEFHWTHKVATASHHVGELEGEQTLSSVTLQPHHRPVALDLYFKKPRTFLTEMRVLCFIFISECVSLMRGLALYMEGLDIPSFVWMVNW